MGVPIRVNFENIKPIDYEANEAYKAIRTNIAFCGKQIKAIVITSSLQGEGKTEVSFRLAISMAEDGKRVVFVDADLRKSVFAGRYHIDRAVRGLTHYLSGIYSKEDVIYLSNIKNLSVIFAGPVAPNPSELLQNNFFLKLMEHLKQAYDYIIIDSPPLGSVIDSAVIAKNCDGAIMVIEANCGSPKLVLRIKNQLTKTGCLILGAILNKANNGRPIYYRYRKYEKRYLLKIRKSVKDYVSKKS
ncbi:CpsD/CapB family tyrosine-protein kinase [Mobilitalea sibirica]|uniref:non-specific protein-tyrosine kinase n=1 Tax=Mobilitalea sibirica TaxID=1462919 RepID=A0A8J7L3B6_9FIRM|nr:CpsD/CapB family tyrosine-protein kinase [Mobilitalea sibirica]